jgi:hypothetical protein
MVTQKSRDIFKRAFIKILNEDMTSVSTGMAATSTENPSQFSGDTYATGDSRVPNILGSKKVKGKKKLKFPIQRRAKVGM